MLVSSAVRGKAKVLTDLPMSRRNSMQFEKLLNKLQNLLLSTGEIACHTTILERKWGVSQPVLAPSGWRHYRA